jgi:plastocyanin
MRNVRLLLAIAAIVGASACADGYSAAAPSPTPTPTPDPAPTSAGTAVSIPIGAESLGNRAFAPDEVEIAVGGTVTWVNNDRASHTTTSNGAGWDSGSIGPGRQFSRTYTAAGTFPYHCAIHPGMVGTVTVR